MKIRKIGSNLTFQDRTLTNGNLIREKDKSPDWNLCFNSEMKIPDREQSLEGIGFSHLEHDPTRRSSPVRSLLPNGKHTFWEAIPDLYRLPPQDKLPKEMITSR